MRKITLIKHAKGAPGLRMFGLGPNLIPCKGLEKLKNLLNQNTLWAKNRKLDELKICLSKSDVIISLWLDDQILGFGRALSDGIYRGVLWDIVIHKDYQGEGFGKLIVNCLLKSKEIKKTEKIYLMTTNQKDFYTKFNFQEVKSQNLLIKEISN